MFTRGKQKAKQKQKVQIEFSHAFFEVGLRVYDIREDYRVSFAMTANKDQDIWRWFWWNEKDLIQPALLLEGNVLYYWYECHDNEFLQTYQPTTLEHALFCYKNKISYYGKTK